MSSTSFIKQSSHLWRVWQVFSNVLAVKSDLAINSTHQLITKHTSIIKSGDRLFNPRRRVLSV
ncbi:MAG: hypothetical protein WBL95_00285 [Microcoleus sp.]